MPTNYGLRTPLYAQASTGNSLIKSAKLSLTISGSLVYAIVKDVITGVPVTFEISELLRDYLTVTISDTPGTTPIVQKIVFTSTITFYSAINAGGSAVGTPLPALSGDAYEGYSLFIDGTNSSIPYRNRASNQPTWLLSPLPAATRSTLYRPSTWRGSANIHFIRLSEAGKTYCSQFSGLRKSSPLDKCT